MLFRGQGTSIEEHIFYFLWPLGLFIIFPTFFPTLNEQRKGVFVIWFANLVALIFAIIPSVGDENIVNWLDYRYRLSLNFIQPNIYSASWAVVFACSLYFYITLDKSLKEKDRY